MKTAQDVIKRIQWDERLDVLNFTVGYEDRFLGILEKPFNDFTWKDLATVGIYDLAIPQHRIQFFKYKGVVVWDKGTQMDNVFGSRGGSTIYEILDEMEERDRVEQDLDFQSGEDEDEDDDDEYDVDGVQFQDKDEERNLEAVKDGSNLTDDLFMTMLGLSDRGDLYVSSCINNP
eukprot:TRINITY_DN3694_c0_g2_i2.p2 TRINITY_DN3694_c0_g2~~TRINITY_DN3694_c0_g2_i2.p2  ORF type:complete len:175 (+),score=35.53 TRINITY_DN3694_c0_g2_i2:111-635(+)